MQTKMNNTNNKTKLWAGLSSEQTNKLLDKFNSSFNFDFRLWQFDLQGSLAHVQMLAECKIIEEKDKNKIIEGLNQIGEEISANPEQWKAERQDEEDIHMAIERRLTDLIGEPARKLHTARSRNDQVATDFKLWTRNINFELCELILALKQTLLSLAERDLNQIIPGYTHLQQAQPISLGHHWMAHYERFNRDYERFTDFRESLNYCPLGAGALAGTTYPIDRFLTAKLLGFTAPTNNSLDSVSDRDFVAEHQFAASLNIVHLSQLSEELILWASEEFKFIKLHPSFATGSSMMPQKRNPDIPELIRGKSGRIIGNLQSILIILKGLPLAYNKDLQEDKQALFDTYENLKICLQIMPKFLESLEINTEKLNEISQKGFMNATDAADYLVKKGISFREAYYAVGQAVGYCLENKKYLTDLNLNEWKSFHQSFDSDIEVAITIETCLQNRESFGGTSQTRVREQIIKSWEQINQQTKSLKIERIKLNESDDSGSRSWFKISTDY